MFNARIKKISRTLALMSAGAVVAGVLNMMIGITTQLAEKEPVEVIYPLIDELTGAFSFVFLIPLMVLLFRRLPLKKENLALRIPIYIAVTIVLGVIHMSFMYFSRLIIYDISGLGKYNYGYIPYRFVMEYLKAFVAFWVVYIAHWLLMLNREKEAQKLRALSLEEQLTKNRLETLKMQLNPHFLFNTLNMISSAMYEDVKAADKMITRLSDLLRASLAGSPGGLISLRQEVEILNTYLEIMKARFGDRLEACTSAPDDILTASVPAFILQPLVENSIKYTMEKPGRAQIGIICKKDADRVHILIEDNGPGVKQEFSELMKKGLGLSNTAERLEKLYNGRAEFRLENRPEGGLRQVIIIPLTENGGLKWKRQ